MGKLLAVTEKMQNKQGGLGGEKGGNKIEKRILRIEKGDERVNIQKKFRTEFIYILFLAPLCRIFF